MYGILAIHEVLHTIRLRGYGILAIHEVYIQLDCVGMARMPYPPTKKAPADVLQELFYILICPLQSFGYILYNLSGTSFTVFRAPP